MKFDPKTMEIDLELLAILPRITTKQPIGKKVIIAELKNDDQSHKVENGDIFVILEDSTSFPWGTPFKSESNEDKWPLYLNQCVLLSDYVEALKKKYQIKIETATGSALDELANIPQGTREDVRMISQSRESGNVVNMEKPKAKIVQIALIEVPSGYKVSALFDNGKVAIYSASNRNWRMLPEIPSSIMDKINE